MFCSVCCAWINPLKSWSACVISVPLLRQVWVMTVKVKVFRSCLVTWPDSTIPVCGARGRELTGMLSVKLTDKGWKFIQIERTTWGHFISWDNTASWKKTNATIYREWASLQHAGHVSLQLILHCCFALSQPANSFFFSMLLSYWPFLKEGLLCAFIQRMSPATV